MTFQFHPGLVSPQAFWDAIGKPSRWRIIRLRIAKSVVVKQLIDTMIPPTTRAYFSLIENGRRPVSVEMLSRCGRALGLGRLDYARLTAPNGEIWELEEKCADLWSAAGRPEDMAIVLDLERRVFEEAKIALPNEFLADHRKLSRAK